MSDAPLIDVKNLYYVRRASSRHYDPWILKIPQFQLSPSEMICLMGESGSGKSTFLNLLAGILTPTTGQIWLDGKNLCTLSASQRDQLRAQKVGMIFQQFNLLSYLSVIDNVLLGSFFTSSGSSDDVDEAEFFLDAFGISRSMWHRRPDQISVGQQQRVAAARALLGKPRMIFADEPTSALDSSRRGEFMNMLLTRSQNHGVAVILVSHDTYFKTTFPRVINFEDLCDTDHLMVQRGH